MIAQNTKFSFQEESGDWTEIANVTNFSPPKFSPTAYQLAQSEWIKNSEGPQTVFNVTGRRIPNVDSKVFPFTAKSPYEHWYLKNGGRLSKNKMPRGKRFRQAIKHYHDEHGDKLVMFTNEIKARKFRDTRPITFFDEMSKWPL